MEKFFDQNGAEVRLAFREDAFELKPMHILVICKYRNSWLMTQHKERGLEFPGGKVEEEESLEEAAKREVLEETGAMLEKLESIGEYKVTAPDRTFVKRIYFGVVSTIVEQDHYHETAGPVLFSGDLLQERMKEEYSFIMKDDVIKRSCEWLKEKKYI